MLNSRVVKSVVAKIIVALGFSIPICAMMGDYHNLGWYASLFCFGAAFSAWIRGFRYL